MIKAAFFGNNPSRIDEVYSPDRREKIAAACDVYSEIVTSERFDEQVPSLGEIEVIFSTWGMPPLNADQIKKMTSLKAVFYGAGTVKKFAEPFLKQGINVVSAWAGNAVPVAEFAMAQILLGNKGYFRNIRDASSPETRRAAFKGIGNYGTTISLLGAGMIGRKVIELAKPYRLHVLVFDPFLSDEDAASLGVEKVSLEGAFSRGLTVSNHVANVPETRGMIAGQHFESMRQDAVFINTGRGATVVEKDMIRVLKERPDLTALLDVTDPEPPEEDSPFYSMPNVILTSHIAGSMGGEVTRMADLMIEELEAWCDGRPLRYEVTSDMLATMA